MRPPTTENKVSDGDGNTQIGHNTGSISIGYTIEQHEAALHKALEDRERLLERAHAAEKQTLLNEIGSLEARLQNVEADHKERVAELENLKKLISRYDNQVSAEKRAAADAAIERGDSTLAQALLKELAHSASLRREDAAREEAELEFELGKLAEAEIRWLDAAQHYAKAARLVPDYDTLRKASDYSERAGDYRAAAGFSAELLAWARAEGTPEQLSNALNEHAGNTWKLGDFPAAEKFFREALEIDREVFGVQHQEFAIRLNNLALVVQAQGQFAEAEGLYRQALEIDRATIGEAHPEYAKHLNNFALVVQAQGRFEEAEGLYRETLEATRAALGEAHPDYAVQLGNLGDLLGKTGQVAEARTVLTQALEIFRASLPPEHPHIAETERRLNALPPD